MRPATFDLLAAHEETRAFCWKSDLWFRPKKSNILPYSGVCPTGSDAEKLDGNYFYLPFIYYKYAFFKRRTGSLRHSKHNKHNSLSFLTSETNNI